MEYIQRLWNEVIAEDATLLEGSEGSQVAGSKYKEVTSRDEKGYQPPKKAKGKYYGDDTVKIEIANLCERYVHTRQDCQVQRIGAMIEQKWSLEGENRKEESGDNKEGFENGPRESQEKGALLSTFC